MRNIIILFFIFICTNVFSNTYIINNIEVKGLKRTKLKTVLNIIELNEGDKIEVLTADSLKQKLLKAGIFTNDIVVEFQPVDESNINLFIQLEDKWTLIPLPFFSYSNNEMTLGGFFIESNLLGLQHSLVGGAIYKGSDTTAFAAWSLPKINSGRISFSLSFNRGEKQYLDFLGEDLESYRNDVVGLGVTYSRDLIYQTSLKSSLRYMSKNDVNYIYNNYILLYNNSNVGEYFSEGLSCNLGYYSEINISKSYYNKKIDFKLEYDKVLLNNLFTLNFNSSYSIDQNRSQLLFGAKKGSLIIPKNEVKANYFLTSHLAYEIKTIEFKWGFITLPLFYEAGIVETNYDKKINYYHGPGFAVNLYMKKVAVPAMGMYYIYDFINNRYNFSFNIGTSF